MSTPEYTFSYTNQTYIGLCILDTLEIGRLRKCTIIGIINIKCCRRLS